MLSGCSTLSLLTATLQQLTRVFELYLGPWGPGQTGFVALPSHPADSPIILQLQFLFDVLQKTLSLKVLGQAGWRWGMDKEPRRRMRLQVGQGSKTSAGPGYTNVRDAGACAPGGRSAMP